MLTLARSYGLACLGVVILVAPVALLFIAPCARADPKTLGLQKVAVAHLDFEGKIPEGLQDLFAQRLIEGLSAARFQVLSHKDVKHKLADVDADGNTTLTSCQSASCYPAVARALSASYLITARVSESNKTYTILMDIINGRTGDVLASNRERCETCGAEEASEKMGLAASALRSRLESVSLAPARFIIQSRPSGAVVTMDGKSMGTTPLDAELAGGEHRVHLELSGYDPASRSFSVVSGVDETLSLELVALPSQFPYRTAGWGGVAGGAVLLLAGIVTMGFDNHEVACSTQDKEGHNGHCPWVLSTKWLGATMIGLGTVAATLGGVFLYLAPRTDTAGAMAGVSGSF
jgi:hypothetical protein